MSTTGHLTDWLVGDDLACAVCAAAASYAFDQTEWDNSYAVCVEAVAEAGLLGELRACREEIEKVDISSGARDAVLAALISGLAVEAAAALDVRVDVSSHAAVLAAPLRQAQLVRELLASGGREAEAAAQVKLRSFYGDVRDLV